MAKPNSVEIVCVIDQSGSMDAIKTDAIGGFNHFLKEQKKISNNSKMTLVLFNNELQVLFDNVDVQNVSPLSETDYCPQGSTALLDAIGKTIATVGERLDRTPEYERPSKVIVAILTDGFENASTKYKRSEVFEMITHQKEKYSWEFVFLAANQNAIREGMSLGISPKDSYNFIATGIGMKTAYNYMSRSVASYRTSACPQDQNKEIVLAD